MDILLAAMKKRRSDGKSEAAFSKNYFRRGCAACDWLRADAVAWNLPSGWTLRLSPGFGLNANSDRFLLRYPRLLGLLNFHLF
jgi:hypothetical protein